MNATGLIVRHHRRIERLLDALLRNRHDREALLLDTLDLLLAHLAAEETIFYPAVSRAADVALGPHREAHRAVKRAARVLADAASAPEHAFLDAARALHATFAHHTRIDERALCGGAAAALDVDALEELGADMDHLSSALANRPPRVVIPTPLPVASADIEKTSQYPGEVS